MCDTGQAAGGNASSPGVAMKGRHWKQSVLKRLIISFILVLTPLYILSAVVYNSGLKTLRGEITASMSSQVGYSLETLDKDAQRIALLQYELFNDKDINWMATIPEYRDNIGRMESLLRIQNRLIAIQNSSRYIAGAEVLIKACEKAITPTAVSPLAMERFERLQAVARAASGRMVVQGGALHLIVAYPYYSMTGRDPLYIIDFELSGVAIGDVLASLRTTPEEGVVFRRGDGTFERTALPDMDFSALEPFLAQPVAGEAAVTRRVRLSGSDYLVVSAYSPFFDAVMSKFVPERSVFESLQSYKTWFVLLVVTAIGIVAAYSLYVRRFIHRPLSILVGSFRRMKAGDLAIHIEHDQEDEFRYIYESFNDMVAELGSQIEQNVRQRLLVQRAEMKQLQSQINPHFLFNSFFIMSTMIRTGDYESLEELTEQLGRYFQHVTRNAADVIPLEKEVDHARIYADIQSMRYGARIRLSFGTLPPACRLLPVPRLILQPLIENAYEHGLAETRSDGILEVGFEQMANGLAIVVENNGDGDLKGQVRRLNALLEDGMDTVLASGAEVTALQNIHQRLRLMYGDQAGLSFSCGSGRFRVTMMIPAAATEGAAGTEPAVAAPGVEGGA